MCKDRQRNAALPPQQHEVARTSDANILPADVAATARRLRSEAFAARSEGRYRRDVPPNLQLETLGHSRSASNLSRSGTLPKINCELQARISGHNKSQEFFGRIAQALPGDKLVSGQYRG